MKPTMLLLLLSVCGCSGTDPGNQPVADPRILVSGDDMGVLSENVTLTRNGFPLTGVAVLVNGTTMLETQPGHYSGQLPAPVPVGGTIALEVISGVDTVTGTTAVPAIPALASPRSGDTIPLGTPLQFSWTDASDPDEFRIGIVYGGTAELASYGPTSRSGLVVTSRIPSNTRMPLSAILIAYADGTFTGPANPDSRMHVRQPGNAVSVVPVQ